MATRPLDPIFGADFRFGEEPPLTPEEEEALRLQQLWQEQNQQYYPEPQPEATPEALEEEAERPVIIPADFEQSEVNLSAPPLASIPEQPTVLDRPLIISADGKGLEAKEEEKPIIIAAKKGGKMSELDKRLERDRWLQSNFGLDIKPPSLITENTGKEMTAVDNIIGIAKAKRIAELKVEADSNTVPQSVPAKQSAYDDMIKAAVNGPLWKATAKEFHEFSVRLRDEVFEGDVLLRGGSPEKWDKIVKARKTKGYNTPSPLAAYPKGLFGEGGTQNWGDAALARGAMGTREILWSGIEAVQDVTGASDGKYAENRSKYWKAVAGQMPQGMSMSDVKGVGSAVAYAADVTLENLSNLSAAALGGLVGGAIRGSIGAYAGAFGPSFLLETGSIHSGNKELNPDQKADWATIVGGTFAGALDAVVPGGVGRQLVGKFGQKAADDIALQILMLPTSKRMALQLGQIAKGGVADATWEGVTEPSQTFVEKVATHFTTGEPIKPGLLNEMVESMVAGTILGWGMGTAGQTATTAGASQRILGDTSDFKLTPAQAQATVTSPSQMSGEIIGRPSIISTLPEARPIIIEGKTRPAGPRIVRATGEPVDKEGVPQRILLPSGKPTSGFGPRTAFRTANGAMSTSEHGGIDYGKASGMVEGAPVKAGASGVIVYAGKRGGYGNQIVVQFTDGSKLSYSHLQGFNAKVGQAVEQGQVIGRVGRTGNATGPHLHVERFDSKGRRVNPLTGRMVTTAVGTDGTRTDDTGFDVSQEDSPYEDEPFDIDELDAEYERATGQRIIRPEERDDETAPPAPVKSTAGAVAEVLRDSPIPAASEAASAASARLDEAKARNPAARAVAASQGQQAAQGDATPAVGASAEVLNAGQAAGPVAAPVQQGSSDYNQALPGEQPMFSDASEEVLVGYHNPDIPGSERLIGEPPSVATGTTQQFADPLTLSVAATPEFVEGSPAVIASNDAAVVEPTPEDVAAQQVFDALPKAPATASPAQQQGRAHGQAEMLGLVGAPSKAELKNPEFKTAYKVGKIEGRAAVRGNVVGPVAKVPAGKAPAPVASTAPAPPKQLTQEEVAERLRANGLVERPFDHLAQEAAPAAAETSDVAEKPVSKTKANLQKLKAKTEAKAATKAEPAPVAKEEAPVEKEAPAKNPRKAERIRAIDRQIDRIENRLSDISNDGSKSAARNYALKLVRDGVIEQADVDALSYMFKDRDMGAEDVVSELQSAVRAWEETQRKQADLPPSKAERKKVRARVVEPVTGGEENGRTGRGGRDNGQASSRGHKGPSGSLTTPPVDAKGQVTLEHFGLEEGLTETDPNQWGRSGAFLPPEERSRKGRAPARTYFGIGTGVAGGYVNEFRDGVHPRYKVPVYSYQAQIPLDRLYDMAGDPDDLKTKGRALPKNERGQYIYNGRAMDGVSLYENLIKDAGYAGYWIKDPRLGMTAAVFEPLSVAPPTSKAERAAKPKVKSKARVVEAAPEKVKPFYSALAKAIEAVKMARASAQQWLATIKQTAGVKQEELEWTTIGSWLEAQSGMVDKDQLLGVLNNNGIKVEEVVLDSTEDADAMEGQVDSFLENEEEEARSDFNQEYEGGSYYAVEDENDEGEGTGKWRVLHAEDGSHDDEIYDNEDEAQDAANDYNDRERDEAERDYVASHTTSRYDAEEFLRENGTTDKAVKFAEYSSDSDNDTYRELLITIPLGQGGNPERGHTGHWEQDDVVVHVRFMEKKDADGKRILFIEEIQSDWHQKGRKKGYKKELTTEERLRLDTKADAAKRDYFRASADLVRSAQGLGVVDPEASAEAVYGRLQAQEAAISGPADIQEKLSAANKAFTDAEAALNAMNEERDNSAGYGMVPDAPFKSTWPALALKRMIVWGAENGFDKVAWTTGAEQNARYPDSYHLAGHIMVEGRGDTIVLRSSHDGGLASAIVDRGLGEHATFSSANNGVAMTKEQVEEVFGDGLGGRLWGAAKEGELASVRLDQMVEVDGKRAAGMKAFYDRNLANIANGIVKKSGGRVGIVKVKSSEGGPTLEQTKEQLARDKEQVRSLKFQLTKDIKNTDMMDKPYHVQQRRNQIARLEHDVNARTLAIAAIEGKTDLLPEGRIGDKAANTDRGTPAMRQFGVEQGAREIYDEYQRDQTGDDHLGFDLTPALKEAATGGFPMFRKMEGQPKPPAQNQTGDMQAVLKEVLGVIEEMGAGGLIPVEVVASILTPEGGEHFGGWEPTDQLMRIAAFPSVPAPNGVRGVARHEIVHWARDPKNKIWTETEWKLLERWAQSQPDLVAWARANYPARTDPNDPDTGWTEEEIIEEMVAEGFSRWDNGRLQKANKSPPKMIGRIMQKLKDIIDRIRQALGQGGMRPAEVRAAIKILAEFENGKTVAKYRAGKKGKAASGRAPWSQALSRQLLGGQITPEEFDFLRRNPPNAKAQAAWHGSPETDILKFSLNYVGKGEGAQSFGWGLYFAQKKGVADYYRRKLTMATTDPVEIVMEVNGQNMREWVAENLGPSHALATVEVADRLFNYLTTAQPYNGWLDALDAVAFNEINQNIADSTADGDVLEVENLKAEQGRVADVFAALEGQKVGQKESVTGGKLYQVEVPEDADLLDLDAPLKDQSPKVRKALSPLIRKLKALSVPGAMDKAFGAGSEDAYYQDISGYKLQKVIGIFLGRDKLPANSSEAVQDAVDRGLIPMATSIVLRDHGIPGSRYLDRDSRGQPEGEPLTSNFVIFDDSLIRLKTKARVVDSGYNTPLSDPTRPDPGMMGRMHDNVMGMLGEIGNLGGKDPTAGDMDSSDTIINAFRRKITQQYNPIQNTQARSAEIQGVDRLSEDMNVMDDITADERPYKMGFMLDNIMQPMFKEMAKRKVSLSELGLYLYARHAPARNERVAKKNPNEFNLTDKPGSGMSDVEAQQHMAAFAADGRLDDFQVVAAQIDKLIQFAQQERLAAGLLSAADVAAGFKIGSFYVPLRGNEGIEPELEMDFGQAGVGGGGFSIKGKEGQQMMGRHSKASLEEIVGYTITQAQQAVDRAYRNRVALSMLAMFRATPDPDFVKIDRVKRVAVWNKKLGQVEYQMQTRVTDPAEIRRTIYVKENGSVTKMTFNHQNPSAMRFVTAAKMLNAKDVPQIVRVISLYTRFFTAANTKYNVDFIIANAAKDIQTGLVNTASLNHKGLAKKMLVNLVSLRALGAAVWSGFNKPGAGFGTGGKFREAYAELDAAGGIVRYAQITPLEDALRSVRGEIKNLNRAKGSPITGARNVARFIDRAVSGFENMTRLAAYVALKDMGIPTKQAAVATKELTTNFHQHGEWGVTANMLYGFANASTIGNARLGWTMMKKPSLIVGFVTLGVIIDTFGHWWDEEEWDKYSEEDKNSNFLFTTPDTWWADGRIPMGWGLNAYITAGRKISELARGRVKEDGTKLTKMEAASDTMWSAFGAFFPLSGRSIQNVLLPTIADSFWDIISNKDNWGRKISGTQSDRAEQRKPESQLGKKGTWQGWKTLAETLNTIGGGNKVIAGYGFLDNSPDTYRYLTEQTVGGAGRSIGRAFAVVKKLANGEKTGPNDWPILRRFASQPYGAANSVEAEVGSFYDRTRAIKVAKKNADDLLLTYGPKHEKYKSFVKDNIALLGFAATNAEFDKANNAYNAAESAVDKGVINAGGLNSRQVKAIYKATGLIYPEGKQLTAKQREAVREITQKGKETLAVVFNEMWLKEVGGAGKKGERPPTVR